MGDRNNGNRHDGYLRRCEGCWHISSMEVLKIYSVLNERWRTLIEVEKPAERIPSRVVGRLSRDPEIALPLVAVHQVGKEDGEKILQAFPVAASASGSELQPPLQVKHINQFLGETLRLHLGKYSLPIEHDRFCVNLALWFDTLGSYVCYNFTRPCFLLVANETQGVIDGRTLHQSVRSRLVQEQTEGLRDSRGTLLLENSASQNPAPSPSDSGRGSVSATIEVPMGEASSPADSGSSAASPARSSHAASEEAGDGQDGETRRAEQKPEGLEDEGEDRAEGMGGTNNEKDKFSFLASGFNESDLGGMRSPPFSLPRVVIGDGHVQVNITLPAKPISYLVAGRVSI